MEPFKPGESVVCHFCHISFADEIAFNHHKVNSARHICCEVCFQDFNDAAAFKLHHDLLHSAEQDLQCPVCKIKFVRLGGLMAHVESNMCQAFPSSRIEAARREKQQSNALAQRARNFNDFTRVGVSFAEEPHPIVGNTGLVSFAGEPNPIAENLGWASFAEQPHQIASNPGLVSFAGEPNPNAENTELISFAEEPTIAGSLGWTQQAGQEQAPTSAAHDGTAVFDGDDLIGGLSATDILNAPWGNEAELLANITKSHDNFPPLTTKAPNIMDAPVVTSSAGNAWVTQKNLFPGGTSTTAGVVTSPAGNAWATQKNLLPGAPSATAPVATSSAENPWATQKNLVPSGPFAIGPSLANATPSSLAITTADQAGLESNPFDPNSPNFRCQKYFIPLLEKYKCPYAGCGKAIASKAAFIAHLKSPAHRNEKLQCTQCYRYYGSATALTQHMESQGVRCKVRESKLYERVVDEVTGGIALPLGKHEDDTVKYVINEKSLNLAGDFTAANRAAIKGKNDTFNDFWAQREPIW